MVTWDVQYCFVALVFTILGLGLVWYVKFLWNRRNLYIYSWNVPGPFAFPLVGAAYLFIGSPTDILNAFLKLEGKFPGLCKLWFGPQLIYLVGDPEHIRKILTHPKCLDKNFIYNTITSIVGTGILTAPVEKWKKHRKMLNPSFNQNILDSFVEVFAAQSNILVQQLWKNVGKKNFDLYLILFRCTFDMICQNSMGVKLNIQTTENVFAASFSRALEITVTRMYRIWFHLDFVWKLFPMSRELDKHLKIYRDVEIPVIQRKMKEFSLRKEATTSLQTAETEEDTRRKRPSILDMILESSDLTEEEIREEMEVLAIGGSDSSAITMYFAFEMLGIYQDIQQRVYEEVIAVVGEDRDVEASDLPNLKYAEMVLKETLRLFPSIPLFFRTVGEDIDLGTTILPTGSSACFCPLHIHRDPKYWPDPLRFDPDRFLPEEVAKRQPNTYIPFSLGSRNCIGGKYGMMNMKTILSMVIRKYKIFSEYKTVEEIKLSYHIVLRNRYESKVSLELR